MTFSNVVSLNNIVSITHLQELSRHMIKFGSFIHEFFIICQSAYYTAFKCRRSNLIHLHFLDFVGD